jgi:hypothetical protein
MFRLNALFLAAMAALCIAAPQLTYGQANTQPRPQRVQEDDGPLFPDLASGLRQVKGCLGVDSARTDSGKQVIFAWFKDKQAVLDWYHSDMHQGVMNKFFTSRSEREPLADIPDDSGPIMAVASITFNEKGQFADTTLPISQIAIELYAPLPGGLKLGGTFAPESLDVKGLQDYSKPKGK